MIRRALLPATAALAAVPLFVAPEQSVAAARVHDAPGSLCARGEVVISHCEVGRKMVSVCGGRAPTPHAQYRFGAPGDIELAFPGPGQSGLTWARESYSGGGAQQLRFSNGGYDYAVYSRTERTGFRGHNNTRFSDGIMVRRGGRLISNRACTSAMRGDAQPDEFMPEGEMMEWSD